MTREEELLELEYRMPKKYCMLMAYIPTIGKNLTAHLATIT